MTPEIKKYLFDLIIYPCILKKKILEIKAIPKKDTTLSCELNSDYSRAFLIYI